MKRSNGPGGFTIIEVMLFLAITGLMMAGVIAGIGGNLNRQRYVDSTSSLFDFMQGQYNLVDNVRSNRSDNYRCNSAGVGETTAPSTRGTSTCSIVGRLVTSGPSGEDITSRPVYATADVAEVIKTDLTSENDLITKMRLRLAPPELVDDDVTFSPTWQTNVYTDSNNINQGAFSLLIIRLPTNGLIRTFATRDQQATVTEVVNAAISQPLELCVNPDGLVNTPHAGVRILPTAANVNGVQQIASGTGVCA